MTIKKNRLPKLPIFFSIALLAALGFFLFGLLNRLVITDYRQQIVTKLAETDKNLDKSLDAVQKSDANNDRLRKINADLAVYYIKKDENLGFTNSSMARLLRTLSVYNVILVDPKGNVISSGEPVSDAYDFRGSDLAPLLDLPNTGDVSETVFVNEEDEDGEVRRIGLYSKKVNADRILVIASDVGDIESASGSASAWNSMMERNTIGKNGFTFAIGTDGYFLYFPFDPAKGKDSEFVVDDDDVDISEAGFSLSDLQDNSFKYLNICGENYYCGIKYRASENAWIVCALPQAEILSAAVVIVIPVLLFTFVILFTLILAYSMIMREFAGTVTEGGELRKIYFRKSRPLIACSLVLILVLSVFIHLFYATSVQETINSQDARALAFSMEDENENRSIIKNRYNEFLLQIATVSARIISDNPKLASRSSLKELKSILNTEHILLYDKNGTVTVSDSTYKGLTLSKDPNDLSYQFRQLLYGTPYVLQDEADTKYLEKPYLYVGSILTDPNGDPDGFVQLAFDPAFIAEPLKSASVEYVLSTYSGTNSSFVFAVDKITGEFKYHPEDSYIGKAAADHGITTKAMTDGYAGYITVSGVKYLCVTSATETDYIFAVTPTDRMISHNIPIVVSTFASCFVAVILLYLLLILQSAHSVSDEHEEPDEDESSFRSDDALKRFLKGAFFVFSGFVLVITVFHGTIIPSDSIFSHIIAGNWENGVHLFSITWCFICICSVGFLTIFVNMLFLQLGNSLSSRGKTMAQMLISLLKYSAIIGVVFSCANRLGVHTDTLLASAGILTIVIGLGAQSLTSDVFDGLFLIIEGAFHVGDIITLDGTRAKVLEIGIRNTRLLQLGTNNTMIVNNSSLKRVINHSNMPEGIVLSVGIDYEQSIEEVEEIIKRELPKMKENIPLAIEGPEYLGVDEFKDSAIMLKFRVTSKAADYATVKRALNREVKLMFDRNGIGIPFNQVVLSKRQKN